MLRYFTLQTLRAVVQAKNFSHFSHFRHFTGLVFFLVTGADGYRGFWLKVFPTLRHFYGCNVPYGVPRGGSQGSNKVAKIVKGVLPVHSHTDEANTSR